MTLFTLLKRSLGQRLIAPFYHTVSDRPLPHIRHLYRVRRVQDFERDLDFLLKHYTPIDFRSLADSATAKGKPPLLLSFDDGLQGFWDPIAPMLQRKGIPAICFLNSAFLDNRGLFYRYKVSLLIEKLEAQPSAISDLKRWLSTQGLTLTGNPATWLLSLKYDDQPLLDALAEALSVDFSAFLKTEQPYLRSDQVEALIRQGFHFGAHSIDHPEYRYLDLPAQLRQTVGSLEWISNHFGLGYRLFSFPFTDYGVSAAFFQFILEEKKAAEYTFGCAGLKTDVHARHVQRIPMEAGDGKAETVLGKAMLKYQLNRCLGRAVIHRQP